MSLALIIALGLLLSHEIARTISTQAVNNTRTTATLTAQLQIQPLLRPRDLREPFSRRRAQALTDTLRAELLGHDEVARIKLWNRDGRIVYSDDPALLGRRFAPSDELQEAFAGETASEVSDLEAAEQARDIRYGRLVEVYVPLHLKPGGRPAGAFEIYVPYRPVAARVQAATRRTMLLVFAGLALLWAILFRIVAGASRTLRRQARLNDRLARYDSLTGLPNRTLFLEDTAAALQREHAHGCSVAVLLLDLDGFKEINDTLGHATGDAVLCEIGRRLGELSKVARLAGDEYAAMAPLPPGAHGVSEALSLAERLQGALEAPIEHDGIALNIDASIGLALSPQHAEDLDALLQHADVALDRAKAHRSRVEVYAAEHDHFDAARLTLLGQVRPALERNEFVLHYQPRPICARAASPPWRHCCAGSTPSAA